MKLSAVATLYKSAPYFAEFYQRVSAAARAVAADSYEIVFVNDGSPDESLDLAIAAGHADPHVVVIDLSRNFGHHKAMMTGLQAAEGDLIYLIDSDLEEEPEWLSVFADKLNAENADMVYGVQARRKGEIFEKVTGALFFRLFRLLTGVNQPDNIVTARLMSRRYVQALVSHRESELNIGGLWIITGFKQVSHTVKKAATSPTTYTLSRKFGHLVNAVTSFSSLPLVFTFYVGMLTSISAMIFIFYLVFRYLFVQPPDGYTSIIASTWLFAGLIIFFLGVQGIYLSKIFIEVKSRPYTVVRQIYRNTLERASSDGPVERDS